MGALDRPARQLAVLLFTDIVGSTAQRQRLGETVADELHAAIDHMQTDVVSTNGGSVVKRTGDGVMAAFASVAAALGCAAGLQMEVARLGSNLAEPVVLRIGVAAGEVTAHAGDFHGMPVILAARLCDACGDGGVLVSDLARALVAGDPNIELADPLELDLKGIDGTSVAWQLRWRATESIAELPAPLRRDSRFAFVGRDAEWERLNHAWNRVRGADQHVVLVSGPPGVGKTRLAAEFADFARADGALVLFGRNGESLSVPYEPFAEAFRQYVGEQPSWALARRLGSSRGDLVRLLPDLVDRVADLPEPVHSDPETERFRLFEAVVQWLSTASEVTPIVLVLDDLQWAAPQTVQLIRHLAVSSTPMSVLILGTVRDTGGDAGGTGAGDAGAAVRAVNLALPSARLTGLVLSGFDEPTTLKFLEGAAGHDLGADGDRVAELVYAQTRGNPFFCRELAFHMVETGALENVDGRWRLGVEFSSIGVPDSVRSTVTDRLGRLPERSRSALLWASMIGLEFDLEVVEALVDFDAEDLLVAIEGAVGAGVLEELGADRFQFTHALVRSTLYESVGTTRRVRMHRQVAEALEAQLHAGAAVRLADLAHHFFEGARGEGIVQAITYSRLAADQAMEQLAYDEADRLYRRAVELADKLPRSVDFDPAQRCTLLTELAMAAHRSGDPGVRELFEAAMAAAAELDDPNLQAAVLLAGARGAASAAGTVDHERVAQLQQVLVGLDTADDPVRAKLLALLATELQFTSAIDVVTATSEHALSMARRLGDAETLVFVLMQRVGTIRLAEVLDEQLADLVELGRLSRDIGDPLAEFFAAYRAADVYLQLGDLAGFERSTHDVRTLFARLGQPPLEIRMLRIIEEGAWLHGDLAEAERCLDSMWSLAVELGAQRQVIAQYGGALTKVVAARGRPELGVPWYEQLAAFSEVEGFRAGLAVILAQSGHHERAHALYDELMRADVSTLSMNLTRTHTLCFLASLCAEFGDVDRATAIEAELSKYRNIWVVAGSGSYGPVTHFLARLAALQGRVDDAYELFAAADASCVSMDAPLLRAWNLIAWAHECAGTDRARELLDDAVALAEPRGAVGIVQAARHAEGVIGSR